MLHAPGRSGPCEVPPPQHGALERHHRAAAALAAAQRQAQPRRRPRLVGHVHPRRAGADLARPRLGLLGAHLHPLAAVLVAVPDGLGAVAGAGRGAAGAPRARPPRPGCAARPRARTRPARARGPRRARARTPPSRRRSGWRRRCARPAPPAPRRSPTARRGRARPAPPRPAASSSTRDRKARPSASRWLVGSSRSSASKRAVRSAASPARAAWPPDSDASGRSSSPASRPASAAAASSRGSRVVAAQGQPPLQCGRVVVHGAQVARRQQCRQAVDLARGGCDPDPLQDHLAGGLLPLVAGHLGQVPDLAVAVDRAGPGGLDPGQHAQQRRLAGPVRPDQRDPAVTADADVDRVQHDTRFVGDGDASGVDYGGRQGCSFDDGTTSDVTTASAAGVAVVSRRSA